MMIDRSLERKERADLKPLNFWIMSSFIRSVYKDIRVLETLNY